MVKRQRGHRPGAREAARAHLEALSESLDLCIEEMRISEYNKVEYQALKRRYSHKLNAREVAKADFDAIRSDWAVVGQDFHRAIDKFEPGQETQSASSAKDG